MSALTPRHACARIRASRGLALIVFIAFSRGSLAASQLCDDKTITRKSIAKLTRSARVAIVRLDVLVDRDDVVAASLSAKARGNFGGSDAAAKWADVETSGARRLRCEGGEASQCSAWYDCGDSSEPLMTEEDDGSFPRLGPAVLRHVLEAILDKELPGVAEGLVLRQLIARGKSRRAHEHKRGAKVLDRLDGLLDLISHGLRVIGLELLLSQERLAEPAHGDAG